MEKDLMMYWTPAELLSYNRLFNIAIGSRGCGKSFSGKRWCINDFINNKKQFIYLRRTEAEIEEVKASFFRDIIKENIFPNVKFSISGDIYYINDREAGYAMALSTASKLKSNSFPDVNKILYDEFLIDKRSKFGYMRDETGMLLNFYETVDRGRDETRILMLSNAMSIINPYFQKWNIYVTKGSKFIKTGKEIITEIVVNDKYNEWKKQTRFGQFLTGTDEGRHMIDNQFVADNYSFVEKVEGHKNYCFTVLYEGVKVGVWFCVTHGIYYCSKDTADSYYNFAFSSADHRINSIMFKNARQNKLVKNLIEAHDFGNVRYENLTIKSTMLQLFDYI